MSLLISDTDLIPIAIQYTVAKNKFGVKFVKVLNEESVKKLLASPETSASVKVLNTKWKPQSWQAQNELFANSMIYNPSNGKREVDWSKFRDQQLKHCLVWWDMEDDNNRQYPVTPENIDSLNAAVANELSNKYSEATSMEEEEAGNS